MKHNMRIKYRFLYLCVLISLILMIHTASISLAQVFTIAPSAGPGGAITPPEAVIVAAGATVGFTITASPGYYIQTLVTDLDRVYAYR